MRTRQAYDQAFELVSDAIARWDPYGLVGGGAPPDEWDGEIARLLPRLRHVNSAAEVSEAVAAVFGAHLEKGEFDAASCANVGEDIYARLKSAGLIGS